MSGCDAPKTVDWPEMRGLVLEEGSDKPIAGAIVVARWKGVAAFTTSVCFHVESTETNEKGEYFFPAWRNDTQWAGVQMQKVDIKGKELQVYDKDGKVHVIPLDDIKEYIGEGCSVCGDGWIEMMPGGPPHPNVLKAGGIDPKKWQGFYINIGLDRLVMMKYGIDDIRLMHSGDLRFLRQF